MGKIKDALRPLGDMPILEHFFYFTPDENDFLSQGAEAQGFQGRGS
jgi:hypothetical protein